MHFGQRENVKFFYQADGERNRVAQRGKRQWDSASAGLFESYKVVWHSAASRNAIDASLATHGGSPGLQAGESFLRIGLSALACRPPENRREKHRI